MLEKRGRRQQMLQALVEFRAGQYICSRLSPPQTLPHGRGPARNYPQNYQNRESRERGGQGALPGARPNSAGLTAGE